MARKHDAAGPAGAEAGIEVGLGLHIVEDQAALDAVACEVIAHEFDEREVGFGRGRVEGNKPRQHLARRHAVRLCRALCCRFREAHTLPSWVVAGLAMMARNSRRVRGSERKVPSMWLVTMLIPGLCTPRVVMH